MQCSLARLSCLRALLSAGALLSASSPTFAAQADAPTHTLLYAGFETGLEGWSPSGEATAYSGAIKLGNGSVQLVRNASLSRALDTTGFRALTLRVSLAGYQLERGKSVVVEVRPPGGSWQSLATLTTPQADGYFRYFELDLPASLDNTALELRVRLNAPLRNDYGYLDEVWVLGQPLASPAQSSSDCPACVADIALYDPATEDDGVWEEEVRALMTLLDTYGWTWSLLDEAELNAGALGSGSSRRFRALVGPGGYAAVRNRLLSAAGENNVRSFLSSGGSYVGFCAGSFWTAQTVSWAEDATGGGGSYHQSSDYTRYSYDLALWPGVAQGPLGWTPWAAGTGVSLEAVRINLDSPVMAALEMPVESRFFYYGGPFFTGASSLPSGYEVWAWAVAPADAPADARTGEGEPVVIHFREGSGHVILFSHHPDILIGSEVDGVSVQTYWNEAEIAWELDGMSWQQQWLDSWNIVQGALQLATGEMPTPIKSMPGSEKKF